MFALTAEDMTTTRKLVESSLNKKTITASLLEQFASDAPATIYVVTRDQIYHRGYESLLDLLDDIPEVEIQRLASPEFNNHISLRGIAGNEKFIVMQDGIRISAPTGDTHSIGMNFSLAQAEQVEVIIGPASALYGADAFSGVIQIITQKGSHDQEMALRASFGMYQTTHNTLHLTGQSGGLKYSAAATLYHSREPNFPKQYPGAFQWYNDRYQPNGELLISPFLDLSRQVDYQQADRPFEMPTTAYGGTLNLAFENFELSYNRHGDSYTSCASTQPEYCIYSKDARFAYFIETLFGRHRLEHPGRRWSLESTFSLHTYQLNNQTAFINTYTGYEPGYKMEFGKSKKLKEQFQYNFSSNTSFIAGLSYEIIDALPLTGDLPKPFDFSQPTPLQEQYYLGSRVTDKDGNDLTIFQDFYYLHYQNLGAFAQLQFKLNEATLITGGLRYDRNTRYGESLNPRLGIVWKPSELWTVKMLYGESLLSPSPRKSNSHFGSFYAQTDANGAVTGLASNFFHLSNPALEPEKLRSVEGSARAVLSNNLVFTLNAYFTRIDNLINKFALNEGLSSFKGIEIPFIETSLNEGKANIYGSTAKLDAVFNLNGVGLNFNLSYSYSDGQSNGEQLLYSAKHTLKAGMEVVHQRFSLTPRLIYRSASYSILQDEEGRYIGTDPYAVVNLFGRFKAVQRSDFNLSFFTKVNNLFDIEYYNAFLGGQEGFARVPQDPIRVTVGIESSF